MFFSHELFLVKKGNLSMLWIAAHNAKRMKKHIWVTSNIPRMCEEIANPTEGALSLRAIGSLLLGAAVFYGKKTKYYSEDALRVRLQFRRVKPKKHINLSTVKKGGKDKNLIGDSTASHGTESVVDDPFLDILDMDLSHLEFIQDDMFPDTQGLDADALLINNSQGLHPDGRASSKKGGSFSGSGMDVSSIEDLNLDLLSVDYDDMIIPDDDLDSRNENQRTPKFKSKDKRQEFDDAFDQGMEMPEMQDPMDFKHKGSETGSGPEILIDFDDKDEAKDQANKKKGRKRKYVKPNDQVELGKRTVKSWMLDRSDLIVIRPVVKDLDAKNDRLLPAIFVEASSKLADVAQDWKRIPLERKSGGQFGDRDSSHYDDLGMEMPDMQDEFDQQGFHKRPRGGSSVYGYSIEYPRANSVGSGSFHPDVDDAPLDSFLGFDLDDFEEKRGKGRRSMIPLDLSDSDSVHSGSFGERHHRSPYNEDLEFGMSTQDTDNVLSLRPQGDEKDTLFFKNPVRKWTRIMKQRVEDYAAEYPNTGMSFDDVIWHRNNKLNKKQAALAFNELLVLASLKVVKPVQKKPFGPIDLQKGAKWGVSFSQRQSVQSMTQE